MVRECHQSKDVDVQNIPGIVNPSDIFTKDIKYNTHFINLRESMMVSLQYFLKYSHNVPSHMIFFYKLLPYYFIRSEHTVPDSIELKSRVTEQIVPKILELQLGFIQTV